MTEKSVRDAIWRPVRLVIFVFSLFWIGGLLLSGLGILASDVPGASYGGLTLIGTGLFLLLPEFFSLTFSGRGRGGSPPGEADHPPPDEPPFDADAAVERYLARKAASDRGSPSSSAQSQAPRPAGAKTFGRRST